MKISTVDPTAIMIPERLRAFVPDKVKQLAKSMAAIGLQQPVTVWSPADGDVELVAGAHRTQAACDLGWKWIDCVFANGMTDIDRRLWEIDENLMRAELSPTEMAEHLARRKELWARREVSTQVALKPKGGRPKGFAQETADATGVSHDTVSRAVSRAKAIPSDIRAIIKGTKLDTGVYLDSLKGMEPDEQRAKVTADLAEPKKPAPVVTTNPAEESLERLKRGWAAWELVLKAETPEAHSRFYAWQAEIINADWRKSIEGIIQTGRDLLAAREELPDGEWGKMIETDLPFSRQTVQQLMAIASDPAIANAPPGQHLPPSWTVLAQLASLSAEDFEDAQERGLTTKRAPS